MDVGGTLGIAERPGITAALVAASPLGARDAVRLLRQRLHTAPAITDQLVNEICRALRIPPTEFPRDTAAAPLRLFAEVPQALERISAVRPVVTLSNVTCIEAESDRLKSMLSPWVTDHFPSCRIGYAKPDRRAFQVVASQWGLHTRQMVHIGDHWECDILGAVHAGARAIWISRGRALPEANRLVRSNVLVAADLGAAAEHVRDLCMRRPR
ncbi:HAD family hydrolase [Plantactinospora sp. CA-294935]|uniref:HAD family hydrolase n=1 Tax=Plantactinospora sp. CA-294935 TaxID=3240012 RepID=UPI003D8C9C69